MDKIDKAITETDIMKYRETLTGISKAMEKPKEKIDIVKEIIRLIGGDPNHTKENGEIRFTNEFRELKYYMFLKELWSTEKNDIAKRIAQLEMIDNELVLLKSAPEIKLLVILNELECKTFKMAIN